VASICVIPCKPYHLAKTRLATCLTPPGRRSLSRWLLRRTIRLVRPLVDAVMVVSRDRDVLADAGAAGAMAVVETGVGLNPALIQAAERVVAAGAASMLVLPADLPLLTAADIAALLDRGGAAPGVVVAPCRHEAGTNALLTAPPGVIPFAFGANSFRRHCALAARRGIVPVIYRSPTLGFDLDTPEDWQAVREHLCALGWQGCDGAEAAQRDEGITKPFSVAGVESP
jgi:2-phospho-L-lactate guanylyltransferase